MRPAQSNHIWLSMSLWIFTININSILGRTQITVAALSRRCLWS